MIDAQTLKLGLIIYKLPILENTYLSYSIKRWINILLIDWLYNKSVPYKLLADGRDFFNLSVIDID